LLAFIAGDWADAASGEVSLGPSADLPAMHAVTASAQHLAGLAALGRGDGTTALEQFDAALRSLLLAPAAAPPYFIAVNLAWTVDDRADLPHLLGEDTMLVGRRIGTEQAVAHVTVAIALARRLAGDTGTALALIDDAAARFTSLDDPFGRAYAAAQRGHTLRWAGDYDAADEALAESEAIRRSLRDQRSVAMSLAGRALVAAGAGAGELARRRGQEAMQMMERSGDNPGMALVCTDLGTVELMLGDRSAAVGWIDRSAELSEMPGGQRAYGWVRLVQAFLYAEAGSTDIAAEAAAAAEQTFTRIGELRGLSAMQRARKGVLSSVIRNGEI
jgi:tetratricopeptide (TPR) repeat protein